LLRRPRRRRRLLLLLLRLLPLLLAAARPLLPVVQHDVAGRAIALRLRKADGDGDGREFSSPGPVVVVLSRVNTLVAAPPPRGLGRGRQQGAKRQLAVDLRLRVIPPERAHV